MNENIVVKVGADITDLSKKLSKATRDLGSFGDDMKNVGAGIATSFGAASFAIAGGLGFAVKKAAEFDTEIRKAGAIAGASAKELTAMKDEALKLGATTSESATSVAAAMSDMAAKGFTANETIAAMPGIISAAAASGEDLALAADTVASALNIWGLEAEDSSRVADILAQSANTSAAGIDDLGYVLKYAGAPASALGISLEEVAAAAGVMTNAGLDGSSAGTSLRQSLLALNNPAKAQAKIMDGLGFSMLDGEGKAKSLSQIVGDLSGSMDGMTESEKVATLAKLVGTEAVSGFLSLTKAGPKEIDKMSQSLRDSGGASEEAASKMKDGIGGALENLSGAFETMSIAIGDQLVPYVEIAAEWLAKLAGKFTGLSDDTQKFLVVGGAIAGIFTAIVAAIGFVLMVIGGAITGLSAIAGVMGIAGGATGLLSAAFALLTGPIGIAVAAIVGIIAALVLAYKKIGWFRDLVNSAWATIKEGTMIAFNAIKEVIVQVMDAVMEFIGDILLKLQQFWRDNGETITTLVSNQFNAIWDIIKAVMKYILGVFEAVWPIIAETVKFAWALIKTIVSSALDIILGIIATMMNILEGDWKGAWDSIKKIVSDVWGNIKKYLGSIDLAGIGKNIMAGLARGISSMAGAVVDAAKGIADAIPTGIKKLLGIHSPSRVLAKLGMYTGMGLAQGLDGEVSTVKRSALTLANAAVAKPTLSYATPSASYSSLSSALSGSVDVSATEQSGLLRELIGAVREGRVVEMDGKIVTKIIGERLNGQISGARRNGRG